MDFLKNNRRFDFLYDTKKIEDCEVRISQSEGVNCLTTIYRFSDGLVFTNIAKKHEKYGAYEWVNWIENTSSKPSQIISELWDCACTFPFPYEEPLGWTAYVPDPATATKIYAPCGSHPDYKDFHTNVDEISVFSYINHIYPGKTKKYATSGGRSSDKHAPFFNIHKDGVGIIAAIGWTGQWNCQITRETESITLKTKIEDTNFRVMPGEKFRTSSIVLMPYQSDVMTSQNQWRRLIKEEFSLIGSPGRDQHGPLCANIWGGMSTQSVLDRIKTIDKNHLPFEYIWMDAGWYGSDTKPTPDEYEGDWSDHTGDWQVSPLIHPNGLKDVSKAIHDSGRKFVLWMEPERVIYQTPIVSQHPEYFLCNDSAWGNSLILNLGDPNAWDYCVKTISTIIEEIGVDCYRQDFNIEPLSYWRKHDGGNRKGITEIKHINGLYRFWDALLERFPHLIIDNCASGGKRIDIETLRRSMPLWRSDHQCPANFDIKASQCHNISFNFWMPYSGTGCGRSYDTYRIRSSYGASMATNYTFSERDSFGDDREKMDWLRKYTEEYLKIRPYFSEDFYPLTQVSDSEDVWMGYQFDRPSQKDGILQLFRREGSPYESAHFVLRGIDPDCDYRFIDADDDSTLIISGARLVKEGISITIKEKRCAKIYFYRALKS